MAGSETRNRGIHGNTLFLFIPIPKSKKKKKCRHINSDDGAMLEEEMIVELLPLFCVWRKKKKETTLKLRLDRHNFFVCFLSKMWGKKRIKRQENSVAIFCVLTKIGHQQQKKKDKNRILFPPEFAAIDNLLRSFFFFFFPAQTHVFGVCNPHCVVRQQQEKPESKKDINLIPVT